MTLRDKFLPFCDNEYANIADNAENCVDVADDYAVDFAMHISKHCFCELGNDTRSYKELLEIFKKEKGL